MGKKRLVLGGALLLTLGSSAWLGLGMGGTESEVEVVETAKPSSAERGASPQRAGHAPALPILANARASGESELRAADIFKPHNRLVSPPPLRQVLAAVIPPAPPPLPFTYLGTVRDGGRTTVFLVKEQRLYTVRNGEVFDGKYRMESDGNGRIELVYLPLNARQTLVIKGAS